LRGRKKKTITEDIVLLGDCFSEITKLPKSSIDLLVTSPPYWGKRIYNCEGELGHEATPQLFIKRMVQYFNKFRPYLKPGANVFVNLGDTYFGSSNGAWNKYYDDEGNDNIEIQRTRKEVHFYTKRTQPRIERDGKLFQNKQLLLIPSRFAIAMQDKGWLLRDDIIWHKSNCKPESVKDRFSNKYEHIFHFVLGEGTYYFDLDSVKIPATTTVGQKNPGNVWNTKVRSSMTTHTATFPEDLVEIMIKCGAPEQGVVLDPFMGTGTTWSVAKRLNRKFVGFEINEEFYNSAINRVLNNPIAVENA
jgi:site-specific DNA-methyltransferase (adenine-specific)